MDLNKVFAQKGLLAQQFDGYEQRPGQVKMAKLVENAIGTNRSAVIEGATGVGKCHKKGTKIILYDGNIKNVEDIRAGELLLGDNSKPRKVLYTNTGNGKLYKIIPVKGEPFIVNSDHILALKTTKKTKFSERKIEYVSVKQYLKKSKTYKHLHKLFRVGVSFSSKSIPIEPYFLGLWLGDGNSRTTGITTQDKEVVKYLVGLAKKYSYSITKFHRYRTAPEYKITNGNIGGYGKIKNRLHNKLVRLNLIQNKHIPKIYKCNSRGVRLKILAGLLDSDGHYRQGGFEFSNTNKGLTKDVAFIARSLGLAAYIKKRTTKGFNKSCISYRVGISGDCSVIPTKIKRKRAPRRRQKKNVLVTGFKIKEYGKGKFYGFSIDKNHCYLLEDFTVCHNSFAYLVPLILSGKQAIISTSHKSLQDQLSKKDLPVLEKILPRKFNWTVLKGKNNYFCYEAFQTYQKDLRKYLSKKEIKEIIVWANETEDGDIEYYPKELPRETKELITCNKHTVHSKESPFYDLCFATKARDKARKAQIVLVNHTLLALDTALRRKSNGKAEFLPKAKVVIVDEAQTFERYATGAFSDEINIYSLLHLINWKAIKDSVPRRELEVVSKALSANLTRFLPEKGKVYYEQKRFSKFDGFGPIIEGINKVLDKLANNAKLQNDEAGQKKVQEITKEGKNLIGRLEALSEEDSNMLRWSEAKEFRSGKILISLKSVPIDISDLLRDYLFKDRTVICTSATLAINKKFEFFKYQIGVPDDALELAVNSPFNFRENVLIYISTGEHEKRWEIEQLLKFSKGNAFVLFTSYRDMRGFFETVDTPYPKLVQDRGVSRASLLEQFKTTPHAILFGTRSFWEGIDVKGNALVLVVIHKIPFETPSDLIYNSKIEKVDQKFGKGKHWTLFTIPDACLKLKQGVGRLIRSRTDVGVIALLDARVNFRNYGKMVINALPPAHRTQKLEKVERFYRSKGI